MIFLSGIVFFLLVGPSLGTSFNRTVFVVMSQQQNYHSNIAKQTENKIVTKLKTKGVEHPHVLLLHRDLKTAANWALFPILPSLNEVGGIFGEIEWFVFVPESGDINFPVLEKVLKKYSAKEFTLVGRLMKDEVASIAHYQVLEDVMYPDFNAGFMMTKLLVRFLSAQLMLYQTATRLKPHPMTLVCQQVFTLSKKKDYEDGCTYLEDPSYELARAILSPVMQQYKPKLLNQTLFCPYYDESCAITVRKEVCLETREQKKELLQKTLFAVKTCQQFHQSRLTVVQNTWAATSSMNRSVITVHCESSNKISSTEYAANVIYVSELEDPKFGTKVLAGGEVNNPSGGPCLKVNAILRHFDENAEQNGWDWLVLVDDDTIFSVSKMIELIGCYASDNTDDDVTIGEIYGNEVTPIVLETGFEYPTGGGGKILNRASVKKLVSLDLVNRCHLSGTMEDFTLGRAFKELNMSLIRTNRFHQFRPLDYPTELLRHQDPVSFHKFVGIDPFETYNTWFRQADQSLKDLEII